MNVLVCYTSRFGSTAEIAARIADILEAHGHRAELRTAAAIGDFSRYDAVVFGSGVYDGSWPAEATACVRTHAAVLARMPVWLFTVGSFGDRHPVIGRLIKKEPREIGEFLDRIRPRDYRVFAGVLNLEHWPAWGRLLFQAFGGHDGDNRDWSDIEAWAMAIGDALNQAAPMRAGVAAAHAQR